MIIYAVKNGNYLPEEIDSLFLDSNNAKKRVAKLKGDWRIVSKVVYENSDPIKNRGYFYDITILERLGRAGFSVDDITNLIDLGLLDIFLCKKAKNETPQV